MATLLKDFPQPWGNRMVSIIDHVGPASYTQITTGSPPTGGDVVTAAEFGLKSLSQVLAPLSDDGTYNVEATLGLALGQEASQARLMWITANTGAQAAGATNLSARSIRLIGIGR